MRSFNNFHEYISLEESLNTPIEFYLTDDTRLPSRVYGVFDIDDVKYGMSLEESDHTGIYILSMYRILAKKPRKWSFKTPSHIRPALSTLLKFIESCVPFVKSKMKAVMIPVSGKNASRYISFAERVLKRSYITSFKVLPVTKSPDQKVYNWEMIFVSRIGISPNQIFSDNKFKKYNFSSEILTHEIAANISQKGPDKKSLKTEPSKKYTFGMLEIENVSIDSEVFDLISKIEPKAIKAQKSNLPNDIDQINLSDDNKKTLMRYKTDGAKKKIANFYSLANKMYL